MRFPSRRPTAEPGRRRPRRATTHRWQPPHWPPAVARKSMRPRRRQWDAHTRRRSVAVTTALQETQRLQRRRPERLQPRAKPRTWRRTAAPAQRFAAAARWAWAAAEAGRRCGCGRRSEVWRAAARQHTRRSGHAAHRVGCAQSGARLRRRTASRGRWDTTVWPTVARSRDRTCGRTRHASPVRAVDRDRWGTQSRGPERRHRRIRGVAARRRRRGRSKLAPGR